MNQIESINLVSAPRSVYRRCGKRSNLHLPQWFCICHGSNRHSMTQLFSCPCFPAKLQKTYRSWDDSNLSWPECVDGIVQQSYLLEAVQLLLTSAYPKEDWKK